MSGISGYYFYRMKLAVQHLLVLALVLLFTCAIQARELSVLLMGDLLLANAVEKRMIEKGYEYPYRRLRPEMEKYDIVFANLETSITDRGEPHPSKEWTFRMGSETAAHIKTLPLHVVSLANNHMLDYGVVGMGDTLSFLRKTSLVYTGVGYNLSESRKPALISRNRQSLAFLAYCERPPDDFYATKTTPGIAPINVDYIREDIAHASFGNRRTVMVSLHWGIEIDRYPRPDQIITAHSIIDAGADVIIGHHPHVPQGVEIYKGRPIFYSLGNAVIGYYNKNYTSNIMALLRYRDRKLIEIEIIPISGDNYKIEFQPYIETGKEAIATLENLAKISKPFGTQIHIDRERGRGVITLSP